MSCPQRYLALLHIMSNSLSRLKATCAWRAKWDGCSGESRAACQRESSRYLCNYNKHHNLMTYFCDDKLSPFPSYTTETAEIHSYQDLTRWERHFLKSLVARWSKSQHVTVFSIVSLQLSIRIKEKITLLCFLKLCFTLVIILFN